MTRATAIVAALATLVLVEGRASADDCLCLGSGLLFEPVDLVETTDAYVDEGEALPIDDAAPVAQEAPAHRSGPVMWCLSADDPRCSRDDSSKPAQRS